MRLPSVYQEVKWIGSNGTQYINTGYIPSNNTKVECSISNWDRNTGTYGTMFGVRLSWSSTGRGFSLGMTNNDSGNGGNVMFGGAYNDFSVLFGDGNSHNIELSQNGFYQDGALIKALNTATFTSPANMYIFALNDNGTASEMGGFRLYSFKIYDSGTLTRDFIPCYRKSDNEIGMYDLVNDTFYTNSGTGIFSKGNDVTPEYKLHGAIQTFHQKKKWKPNENTIAYLKLEENANDSSGNGNNGTASNITYTTLSTGKKVATFNGSSSKIDFSSPLFTSGPFTCSIWIYGNQLSVNGINIIMGNGPTDSSGYLSDRQNDVFRTIINNKWDAFTGYGNDKWMLYTIAYDGNTSKSYKNGTYMATMDGTTVLNTSRNFYIGYRAYSNDRYWKGYMSDFICEDRVWSEVEIQDYFNQTKKNYGYIPNSNTVVYYPLNSTTTVNDLSSNNYTLTQSSNVSFETYQGVDCARFTSNGSSSGDCGLYRTTDTIITTATTDLTFSVWLYKGAETMYYNPRIIGKYNSYGAIFTYANRERISVGDDTTHGIIPDDNKWFLFTCVYKVSDGTWTYYKDGAYVDTQTNTSWQGNTNLGIVLGTRDNLGTGYGDKWSGGMSDVIIENRAWTAKEVLDYFNRAKSLYGIN